jgi:hypothetical protein
LGTTPEIILHEEPKFRVGNGRSGEACILFNRGDLSDIVDGFFGGLQVNFDAARNFETLN